MSSPRAAFSHLIKRAAKPGGAGGGGGGGTMNTNRDYNINLSVQQVLSLWVQGSTLQHFTALTADGSIDPRERLGSPAPERDNEMRDTLWNCL
ncbi:unnamed protein product [Boreogadus saida]